MSQQDSSYFDPERETVYESRRVNRDPRESYEWQESPEQTGYYVTPEQSMLRGRKLVPAHRTKSYSNWIATAVFLLMLVIGGLTWGIQASAYSLGPGPSGYPSYPANNRPPYMRDYYHHHHHHHRHYHMWHPPSDYPTDSQGGDNGNP